MRSRQEAASRPCFLAAGESGRYWLARVAAAGGGIGLFSRVRKDAVLEQENRQRVFSFIEENPGIHYRGLRVALGLGNGTLAHHLATLEREGFVQRRRHGRRIRFHVHERPARPLSRPHADILSYIAANPGCSRAELAKAYGVTRQNVHHHVKRLTLAGIVEEDHGLAVVDEDRFGTCPNCHECFDSHEAEPLCPSCDVDLDHLRPPVVSLRRN